MKILYMTQHYRPEAVAAAFRSYDMTQLLAEKGHEVTVITGFPNDLNLREQAGCNGKLFYSEFDGKVKVIRVYTPIDTKKAITARLFNYFSYMYLSFMAGFLVSKPDVVYASTPPMFVAVSGMAIKDFRKSRFVVEVRDLWVDFAVMLGQLDKPYLIRFSRWMEKRVFKNAHSIVAVTDGFRKHLQVNGLSNKDICVVYNGVDFSDPACAITEENVDLIKQYGLEEKFVVCYAGNVGMAQGLGVVIEAAKILKESDDVSFLIIGEGADKDRLMALANDYELNNVIFIEQQEKQAVVKCINVADCCLVTLKNDPLFHITLPSKLFDYMAFSSPVLLGVDGEARGILEDAEAGLYFDVDNPRSLVKNINIMKNDKALLRKMGENGRNYVYKNFNREILADKLSDFLNDVIDN